MRIIYNQSQFVRLNGEGSVNEGLYFVIARNNEGQRLVMREDGHSQWILPQELMTSFREATRYETTKYFNTLRKNALVLYDKEEKRRRP
jgi:hypothetical protein